MLPRNYLQRLSKILLAAAIIFLCSLPLHQSISYACDCMIVDNKTAMEQSGYVFDGTVTNIRYHSNADTEVTFKVNGSWKGELESKVTVYTYSEASSCTYPFEQGEKYIVFTENMQSKLLTHSCMNTAKLEVDSPIYEELGQPNIAPVTSQSSTDLEEDYYAPSNISDRTTEETLEQRLDKHQNNLKTIFIMIGLLPILAVVLIIVFRRQRK